MTERVLSSVYSCFPRCLECGDKSCFHKDRFLKRKQLKLWKVALEWVSKIHTKVTLEDIEIARPLTIVYYTDKNEAPLSQYSHS